MADDFLDFLNKIQTQYPQAVALLSQPGVAAVYAQAVKENWPPERVEAALEQTQWWQSTPAPVRQFQALQATDPATATEKAEFVRRQIDDIQASTGLRFANDDVRFAFFVNAVQNGWDANQIRYNMLASVNMTGGGGGEVGNNAATVKSLANDYGVTLSDLAVMGWAKQLASGAVTPDAVKGYLIEQAKSRFPGLADALDRGISVRQYADQYLQVLQQETGANVAAMSITDPKIMAALDQVDAKTGQHYAMTISDWTRKVRTDPVYGYDQGEAAHTQVASLATQIASRMGAI